MALPGGEDAEIDPFHGHGGKAALRIIIDMRIDGHFPDPVPGMPSSVAPVAGIVAVFLKSPGDLLQGVTGGCLMPGSELENVIGGIQAALLFRRQEGLIRGSPVDIGNRILLELAEIPDRRLSGIDAPRQEQQPGRISRMISSIGPNPFSLTNPSRVFSAV